MSGSLVSLLRAPGSGIGSPLSVVASPDALYGFNYGYGTVATADSSVLEITGGIPPYTVLWSRISGPTSIKATYSTQPRTTFEAFISNTTVSGVWKATVTDSDSNSVDSNNVTVTLESFSFPGGGIAP